MAKKNIVRPTSPKGEEKRAGRVTVEGVEASLPSTKEVTYEEYKNRFYDDPAFGGMNEAQFRDLANRGKAQHTREYTAGAQQDAIRSAGKIQQRDAQVEVQTALHNDFSALREQRPEDVQDWQQMANLTVQLGAAGDDEEARDLKNALLVQYGEQLRPHLDAIQPGWFDENYEEPEEPDLPFWQDALLAAKPGLDYLDQWGQGIMGAIGGIEAALDRGDEVSAGEGIAHAARSAARAFDPTRAIPGWDGLTGSLAGSPSQIVMDDGRKLSMDRDGDGSISLREALGKDPEAGGRLLTAVDIIGAIALDPTTYVTFGASAMAKVGMSAVAEVADDMAREGVEALGRRVTREMAEEMNQRIMRNGFKSLDEAEQRFYQSMLKQANETALEAGGRSTTRFGRDLVEAQMDAIQRGGQSGVRFGGTTIAPTGRLGEAARSAGLAGDVRYGTRAVDEVADAARVGDETVDVGTDLVPARGIDVRETDRVIPGRLGDNIVDLPADAIREIGVLADAPRLIDEAAAEAPLTEVFRQGVSQGLLGQIASMPSVNRLLSKLSPRAAIRARYGNDVADQLGSLLSVTREDPELKDIMIRMGADMNRNGLMKQSIGEFAAHGDWERAINEALSSPEGMARVLDTAGESTTNLINTLDGVRVRLRELAIKGGANPEHLRDLDSYIPRVLSDSAKADADLLQRIKNVDDPAFATGGDRLAESFMQNRTIAENLDNLFDANTEANRVLRNAGIGDPAALFETNPVAAFAARSQSAFRASSDIDLLDGVTKLTGFDGLNLGFRASADDAAKLSADEVAQGAIRQAGGNVADFRKVTLDNGDVYRIHNDIANEMEDVRRVFGDPKQTIAIGDWYDKLNNMWALNATVSLVNPGFHVRNMLGNWFNAFLGGTRNPEVFVRAGTVQRTAANITQEMRRTGDDFLTAARKLDVDDGTRDLIEQARKAGVLGDGRSTDVLRERGGQEIFRTPTGQENVWSKFDPSNPQAFFNKPGVDLGNWVENNGRLGAYIDQLDKGATPAVAADHVKRYLFDYGDLTRFENESIRRVSRFYTFMRKNTALQAYSLAHYPARVANAEAGTQGIVDTIFGGESDQERALPPWMPGASIANVGGTDLAMSIDTPFASFEETVDILLQPPSDDLATRLQADGYFTGMLDRTTSLFSGVGPGTVEYLQEISTGRDAFSGRNLNPTDGTDHARDDALFNAFGVLFPAMGRVESIGARAGVTRDGEAKQETVIQAINLLSGLKTYALTEDTDGTGRYVLMEEIKNILEQVEQETGVKVPTVDEMREAGDIQMRNRVVEALMYGWVEDPETGEMAWSDEVTDDRLLNIVPKNVREALGLPEPGTSKVPTGARPDVEEGSAEELAQKDFDFKQALDAIETYLDRELTEDERWAMVSTFGGAMGVTEQEAAGFNPYRENRLLDPEGSAADEEAAAQRKEQLFNQRLSAVGMTWDEVLQRYPRISTMERNMADAREAGWTDEEIRQALYFATDEGGEGWTSRADRAAINQFRTGDRTGGAVPLTTTRHVSYTDEDMQKLQTKVWNAAEELRFIYQFEGWGQPSEEELFMYGVNTLTKGEQRLLGIDPLRGAPSRDDTRTDEEKQRDAEMRLGAVEEGLQSPYRWEPGTP